MSTETETKVDPKLADRVGLKAFAEACMVLEEGIAGIRDIDLGMMMGTGMIPGPFARADFRGLDEVLAAMESAADEWGEAFEPPLVLRRLVAQGRLGAKTGQGFYPYPQPDPGYEQAPVKLDTRDDVAIVWLDNPPANSISPDVIAGLQKAWEAIEHAGSVRVMVLASPNPALFCAGADIKAFTKMDEAGGRELLDRAHGLFRSWERSRVMTIAAVNGLALGGGCEVAMACDVRLAAFSASFGQPEIALGILPGFGGTQRLPRLVGPAKALEMNTTGEPISAGEAFEYGLVNTVVPDHELFDAALNWAQKFARQAPVALEQIKRVSHAGDLDEGIEAEKAGFIEAFGSEDAREGISAFLGKRTPRFQGKWARPSSPD
jgi:enoyl-CoA hydratase/carnithine racemase